MKLVLTAGIILLSSTVTLANNVITCKSYRTPKVCYYEPYELRGWDCGGKKFPVNSEGVPYDSVAILNLNISKSELLAVETVFDLSNKANSQKLVAHFNSPVCISQGIVNCETADRSRGLYLNRGSSQDQDVLVLNLRNGSNTEEISTYSICE